MSPVGKENTCTCTFLFPQPFYPAVPLSTPWLPPPLWSPPFGTRGKAWKGEEGLEEGDEVGA